MMTSIAFFNENNRRTGFISNSTGITLSVISFYCVFYKQLNGDVETSRGQTILLNYDKYSIRVHQYNNVVF